MRYHASEDGTSRPCKAKTKATCRAKGANGEKAEHGDFNTLQEAQAFAEKINAKNFSSVKATASKKTLSKNSKLIDLQGNSSLMRRYGTSGTVTVTSINDSKAVLSLDMYDGNDAKVDMFIADSLKELKKKAFKVRLNSR